MSLKRVSVFILFIGVVLTHPQGYSYNRPSVPFNEGSGGYHYDKPTVPFEENSQKPSEEVPEVTTESYDTTTQKEENSNENENTDGLQVRVSEDGIPLVTSVANSLTTGRGGSAISTATINFDPSVFFRNFKFN